MNERGRNDGPVCEREQCDRAVGLIPTDISDDALSLYV